MAEKQLSGNNYYDVERLFNECVEKNFQGESSVIGVVISQSTYTLIWNSFVKWVLNQLELGRAVNVHPLGMIGIHALDERRKILYVMLSENFQAQYGLNFKFGFEKEIKINPGPSVKLNYRAMAKDANIESQAVSSSLSNLFGHLGQILAEGKNVEIDLGPLGKLTGLDKNVTFSPPYKQKPSAIHGKQTVMNLINMTTESPLKRAADRRAKEEVDPASMEGSPYRYQGKPLKGSSLIGTSSTSIFKSLQSSKMSPTRRFKKPVGDGKIESSLLGAGADPLTVMHEFSFLTNNTDRLIKTYFKKPPGAGTRFPPVIDPFSRTGAAPINSEKSYLSYVHRIGAHYTPSSRGLFIDPDMRIIKYQLVEDASGAKLNMMAKGFVEPCTEEEEYESIVNRDQSYSTRIQARKKSYQRYKKYIEEEISMEVVAPFRREWVPEITEKVPGDLHAITPERIQEMLIDMFNEIETDYINSVRKSILDYVLKSPAEKERLGIPQVFNPPNDYGSQPFVGIEPDEDWRNNAVMAAMLMRDKLCIFNEGTRALMELWQSEYDDLLFVKLPEDTEEEDTRCVSINEFIKNQENQMSKVHGLLANDWNKKAVNILREQIVKIDKDQTKTFFEAVSTLMSNQVRSLIEKSVNAYVTYFKKYDKNPIPSPDDVITRRYAADEPFERNFLMLKLKAENRQSIIFTDPLHNLQKDLMKVIEDIIKKSQNLPRPENTIARSEKTHLWEVPTDDKLLKLAEKEIYGILEANLNEVEKVYNIYNPFAFILEEQKKVDEFVQEEYKHDRSDYQQQIAKYRSYIQKINDELPDRVRMNMFVVDCREINAILRRKCGDLIDTLSRSIAQLCLDRSHQINSEIDFIQHKVNVKIEDEKHLTDTEDFLEKAKNSDVRIKKEEYADLLQWVMMLMDTPYTLGEELKNLNNTFQLILNIDANLEHSDGKLKDQRNNFENNLAERKDDLQKECQEIADSIDKFKNISEEKVLGGESNWDVIDKIISRIARVKEDVMDLNDKEVLLGMSSSEYPKLIPADEAVKPYDQLWKLYQKVNQTTMKTWKTSKLKDLNPQIIEDELKFMEKTAQTLRVRFGKGNVVPGQVAATILNKITEFKQHRVMISCLCNSHLQPRHWKRIVKVTGKPQEIFDTSTLYHIMTMNINHFERELEEISEQADKEGNIENMLKTMMGAWEPVDFVLKAFKNTGTYIIDGQCYDDMMTMLDDHLVKTQSMKGSPFAKVFETQIIEWEAWINNTIKAMESWMKVQGVWMYLEPIFNSEDIMQQLPKEGAKFKEVDKAWKMLMEKVNLELKSTVVTRIENLQQTLDNCNKYLEDVQTSLSQYLESKRKKFPRFFFLSNDELLEILSETKEPLKVQRHLKKCFEGIDALKFDNEKKIHGMISPEEEYVEFLREINPSAAKGCVEEWLGEVEDEMTKCLKDVMARSLDDYTKRSRTQWILQWPGQVVLSGAMTFWTEGAEAAMRNKGNKGLQEFLEKLEGYMLEIVELVRGELKDLERCTLQALVVLDVHNRDVIKHLVKTNVEDATEFAWLAQTIIKMINATLDYNYEYLGNSNRLVITPLTDRCYRTLCGAIHLNYGGAPEGPAGTGKTETVKDLAKALARQCVVFNCSDALDHVQMGKFFKGLASCGAWSCFDEFNRIELEVLSVIAQQLHTIQTAVGKKQHEFAFENDTIALKWTCNCFITMNPGYAGRAELPDNLKALFRTVAMMVPDYALIASIRLYSYGFAHAEPLSTKIVATYKLCSEQLSRQKHYDYGMRAVIAVLIAAGNLKRKEPDTDEHQLMLRAINDVNLAKFLAYDLPLFKGIASDLFPRVECKPPDYDDMTECIVFMCKELNLQVFDYFTEKIIQLYEMIVVRHGLMVVGEAYSGKSTAMEVLAGALTELHHRGLQNENEVKITRMNPKSVTRGQLYGKFDEKSLDWQDGIMATHFREFSLMDPQMRKWMIFDGPVDALWIENMNTVLDDNKTLCLSSGEKIQMAKNMNLIYEPMDLAVASPATVSRCGMIYMEPHNMGWDPIYQSWLNNLPKGLTKEWVDEIIALIQTFVAPMLKHVREKCKEVTPTQDQNLVVSMLKLFMVSLKQLDDSQEDEDNQWTKKQEHKKIIERIDSAFLFAMTWSMMASVQTDFRKRFDIFFKGIINSDKKLKRILPGFIKEGLLYEFSFDVRNNEWKRWVDIEQDSDISPKASPQEIIITTIDVIRYSNLLKLHIFNRFPCLFCGPTGTGKSVYVKDVLLNRLDQSKYVVVEIGFSAQTSANQVQDIVDGKFKRRRKGIYGPPLDQNCVVFVDDMNMPKKEFYGAQPPIELLRQLIGQGGWYDRKEKDHKFQTIIDTVVVAAMGEPGGGKSFITPRCQRLFNVIGFANFDDGTMTKIFTKILEWFFSTRKFDKSVEGIAGKIVLGTLEVYKRIQEQLKPTPAKIHYTFNLRDFSKVVQGICLSGKDQVPNIEVAVRLWTHEVYRVFGDRLINDFDRQWLLDNVREIVKKTFSLNFDSIFKHLDKTGSHRVDTLDKIRGLLFGDVLAAFGSTVRPYEEIQDFEVLKSAMEEALEQYNLISDKPMELVLFSFAIEHLVRISRILKQPGGHALLVGVGGSGRQSLCKLAAKIPDFEVMQIELKRGYGMYEWREDMKEFLRNSGGKGESAVFLFNDTQMKEEGFLEDINNMLNVGEIPNLFPADEKSDCCEMVRNAARQERKAVDGTIAQLFAYFVERCKKLLHIVLCFSPIGKSFSNHVRNFPSLVNCTTIDWFSDWPADALTSVAEQFLGQIEMDAEVRQCCVDMCKHFHMSTIEKALKFKEQLRRIYYVTPTTYLGLITGFQSLLKQKREEVNGEKEKYTKGHQTLVVTSDKVETMRAELTELKPQLEQANKETAIKVVEVGKQAEEVNAKKEIIAADEAEAAQARNEAASIKKQCEMELAKAKPALDKAEAALKNIKQQEISFMKALNAPHENIKYVMQPVCILFDIIPEKKMDPNTGKKEVLWWPATQKLMGKGNFLKEIQEFKREERLNEDKVAKLTVYTQSDIFKEEDDLKKLSIVAFSMASWVSAMEKFYYVNKEVIPLRENLKVAQGKLAQVEAALKIKQAELKAIVTEFNKVEAELHYTQDKKDKLQRDYDLCSLKLERAIQLNKGLGTEKLRWSEESVRLCGVVERLIGDVLISSGMIAYCGPFTSVFRNSLTSDWVTQCSVKNIPASEVFKLEEVLGEPVKIREWQTYGLPSDAFSVENAIIIFKTNRWPLNIDPQGQANKWLKSMEKDHNLHIIKFTDPNYMRTLENCIQIGNPVLLENIAESLDPALDPLLQKQIIKKGTMYFIKLGEHQINYSSDFRFYITTKLRNPHYLPEVTAKVTLLNFMITYEGLAEQLLSRVVSLEKPELEEEKELLIIESAKNKAELQKCEAQILKTISSVGEKILEDESAIQILNDSKKLQEEIAVKQEETDKKNEETDKTRNEYNPVAEVNSGLFFCISDLANIDPMYQYSLVFFFQLFKLGVEGSEKNEDIAERCVQLNEYFLYLLYKNICRSLFEKDKLIFSFLLTMKLEELKGNIDSAELRFLLTGDISTGEKYGDPPAPWISNKAWGEINRLTDKYPAYKGYSQDVKKYIADFSKMYDASKPYEVPLPGKWEQALNSFQKLLILRTIRPDKIIPAIQNFVIEKLADKYIKPPPPELRLTFEDSTKTSPIIFVLSPGADPFSPVQYLSEEKNKQLYHLSLGKGQGVKAAEMIERAKSIRGTGGWVMLENCHLLLSWMTDLEKICDELMSEPGKVHRDFRLWLTSYPNKDFPVSVLQNGIKMTNEAPKGLVSNLTKSFLTEPISNEEFFEGNNRPFHFKKLMFGLIFFHAVVQERRKYGPLGWNIPYEFTEHDLKISVRQLDMYLNEYPDSVPFAALNYLTGECNYGGRVTDDKDRRLILCLLEGYYNNNIFNDDYKFSPSGLFYVPKIPQTLDEGVSGISFYEEYVRSLPRNPSPEVYGFHDNADITKDMGEVNLLFNSVLSTQSQTTVGGGLGFEETIKKVAEHILDGFPEAYNVKEAEEHYPVLYEQSMNTVLTQELTRFNHLTNIIRSSLRDILKALQGLVLMSTELEECCSSIYDGKIPFLWENLSYPSLKNLTTYIEDLKQRLLMFDKWIEEGMPPKFWISGFHFTQGFLTGALQNYARKYVIPIDIIEFDFEIINEEEPPVPEDGVIIHGLFLEGCRFNYDEQVLDESEPKKLFIDCPMLWLKPGKIEEMKEFQCYGCPVYKTSERRGVLSTTGHSTNFVMMLRLPAKHSKAHWIKRGVACLTQLDD